MDALTAKVEQEIIKAIDQDRLVLPTLPEIALKVREVADDPDASIQTLTAVISNDAALTARIIKVANSPIFRAPREIEDLNMALSRLGMQYTCNLATGLAMEQMFQATSDLVDKRLREVWSRSSEIAGICHVLCKHFTKLRPDQAALAGLVHQIGILPILSFAEDHTALLRDSMTLDKIIADIHPNLGIKILEAWEFPTELRVIPRDHLDFSRQIPQADYADLVTVAMLQSYAGSDKNLAKVDYTTVTAFERLGLDPNIESAEAEDLSADMEAAMAMLQ
ncbi:HDOD domain-containing protein [Saccharophagus degradans]|uniref:HDOD domain-containing protein n=1 Tax=Saccharophagus degradans TaxID=86304 RepID=A0AAW7WZW6_9GAMM|nr:HDOD domain-containing protein [Saccharophagus degradans]MDO6420933.1 HDOD domain-containing protein [Saccharophagus degradans]MDO6606156.1 HDOD domain-containing protein [Saccharophagus degradans]